MTLLSKNPATAVCPPNPSRNIYLTHQQTKEDLLKKIKSFIDEQDMFVRLGPDPTLVILTTPSFVTGSDWLGQPSFVPALLDILLGPLRNRFRHANVDVNVLVAVVDRLPTPGEQLSGSVVYDAGSEGFAFLYGEGNVVAPGIWKNARKGDERATLKFSLPGKQDDEYKLLDRAQITIPLANTLFCNGQPNMLRAERWRSVGFGDWYCTQKKEKATQKIRLQDLNQNMDPIRLRTIATPLTPLREIASGLGNIVREIIVEEEGNVPVPASRELEATVDDFFEVMGQTPRTVQVWALVYPKENLLRLKEFKAKSPILPFTKEEIRANWTSELAFTGKYLPWLIDHGGRLHRVCKCSYSSYLFAGCDADNCTRSQWRRRLGPQTGSPLSRPRAQIWRGHRRTLRFPGHRVTRRGAAPGARRRRLPRRLHPVLHAR